MNGFYNIFSKLKANTMNTLCMVLAFCAFLTLGLADVAQGANKIIHQNLDKYELLEVTYDNSNGLDSSAANDIVQTKDGFIWIGTYNGLSRYDGITFEHFPVTTGIYSVADLYVDSKDRLWIGTNDSGLALYDKGSFRFWRKTEGLSTNTVRSIVENDEGTMFVGTTDGICIQDEDTYRRDWDFRVSTKYIKVLRKAAQNRIVGVTKKGDFFIYKGKKLESYFNAKDFTFGNLLSVAPDTKDNNVYWVGTTGNKVAKLRVEKDKYTVLAIYNTGILVGINDLLHRANDEIFVASDNGYGFFDKNLDFHIPDKVRFNNSLENVMVDYEGNIWSTSSRMGVGKLTKNNFSSLFGLAGLKSRVVNAITNYNGVLYIATDSGLLSMQGDKRITTPLSTLLSTARTRHLLKDSKGNLWISTYSKAGLIKYSPDGSMKFFGQAEGMPHERVRVAMETADGAIYAGTRDGLAIIRDDKVVKTFTVKNGLANSQVLCLLEDRARSFVYIGTDGGGINVMRNDDIVYTIDEMDGLQAGVILRMAIDPEDRGLWISTGNSIAYYKDAELKTIHGFPSTNNFDFIFASHGDLLITCNQGIYVTTPEKMRKDGSYDYLLSPREGLSGALSANSFNYVDANERLYLCLQNGVDILNIPALTLQGVDKKKFSVPSIEIDGKSVYLDDSRKITIPKDAKRISFKAYVLTNTLNSAKVYTFLEGFDKEPEILNRYENRVKTYTNLDGGTYKLHVGIIDPKTGVMSQEKVYEITKEKRLEEYPAFILAVIFGVVAAGFGCYRVYMLRRMRALRDKQKETEELLDQVINSFARAIDMKDHYTRGHSTRVAEYSKKLALAMGWSEEEAENLHRIALLHDVGKVLIPIEVLNKPGKLTDEEYATMKTHTDLGADILDCITKYPMIALGARTHHERYDGRGYGHQLAGEAIPLEGRIIAVADTFDAMNSSRVYRPALTKEKIISELERAKNTQLDGKIVDVMLKLIADGTVTMDEDKQAEKA